MIKTRIEGLDLLKFICIVLVAFGHLPIPLEFRKIIYVFHIPLFLIISGFLYKKRNIKEELQKDWKSLILPYILVSLICIIWWILTSDKDFFKLLLGLISGENYDSKYWLVPSFALWYVVALFWLRILATLVSNRFLSLVSVVVILFSFRFDGINTVLSFDSAVLSIPFFYTGVLLRKFNVFITNININVGLYFMILFICIIIIIMFSKGNHCDISNGFVSNNPVIFYMLNIIFGSTLLELFLKIRNLRFSKFYQLINEGLILIVGCHVIVEFFIWCHMPFITYNFRDNNSLILGFIISFVTICFFYYPIKIAKKIFPSIIGR